MKGLWQWQRGLTWAPDGAGSGGAAIPGAGDGGDPGGGSGPGQAPGGDQTGEQGQAPGSGAEWTLEAALREIEALRKENAKHRTAKNEAEKAAQAAAEARLAEEKRWEELAQKREKERAEAEQRLEAMQREVWRQRAAQAAGLPPELAARLQGEDEAAMVEDAKALAKLLPQGGGPGAPPGPQKRPAGLSEDEARERALRQKRRTYGSL